MEEDLYLLLGAMFFGEGGLLDVEVSAGVIYNYLSIKLCEVVRVVYLGVLSIEKSKTPFGLGHSFF